jgi:DNA adenine methylase
MFAYLPDMEGYTDYRETFLGGGSVAIAMAKRNPHLNIWVNDLYWNLYNFYVHVQQDGKNVYTELTDLRKKHATVDQARELFNESRVKLANDNTSNFDKAVCFYIANKCSFSGLTETGSFSESSSESNFTINNIKRIPILNSLMTNWKITNESYEVVLDNPTPNTFVYLDPPYDIKDVLYGKKGAMHKGFDHELFAQRCNDSPMDMMISYNADQFVKDRFPEAMWNHIEFDLTYSMRSVGDYMKNQKGRKELLMINYESLTDKNKNLFSIENRST